MSIVEQTLELHAIMISPFPPIRCIFATNGTSLGGNVTGFPVAYLAEAKPFIANLRTAIRIEISARMVCQAQQHSETNHNPLEVV